MGLKVSMVAVVLSGVVHLHSSFTSLHPLLFSQLNYLLSVVLLPFFKTLMVSIIIIIKLLKQCIKEIQTYKNMYLYLKYIQLIMLAIDFPRKKRIFIMYNNDDLPEDKKYIARKCTTREMISDIFLTNNLNKLSNFFFIFRQIFTNNSIRKFIEITLDIQNDIHDTRTRKKYFY